MEHRPHHDCRRRHARGALLQAGNRDDFKTDLSAGETFEVPPGFLGAYAGDLDDAGNSVRRYLFHYTMPGWLKKDPGYPKVEWNAFAATGKGQGSWQPTEKKYYPLIDDIAPLGIEEVVIDINWWSSYGDPGHIVTNAADWPPAWPRPPSTPTTAACVSDFTTTSRWIDHGGRQEEADQRHILLAPRSEGRLLPVRRHRRPPCSRGPTAGHRAHYPEDVVYWSTKGLYEVLDIMYAQDPSFLWEDCASGGRIKDYGAARRAAKIQNQDTYRPIEARKSFYDSSFALHPMQLAALVGSWADWQAAGSVYEFRSASMGAAYWHPDAPNGGNGGPVWSARQKAAIKKAVTTYKTKIRPLVRSADLYHIFPRPDDVTWDGIEYYDPAVQKGVVYIFKPKSPLDTWTIKPRGLDAGLRYKLSFEDGTNPTVRLSGRALTETGLPVTLKGTNVSELMFVEKD